MRRTWLARAVLTAAALSVPVVAMSATAQAATLEGGQRQAVGTPAHPATTAHPVIKGKPPVHASSRRSATYEQVAAAVAKRLVGDRYSAGGTSPAGFDCSGLTQYVYRHTGGGKLIRRTAESQFRQFRPVSHRHAKPGDLVFFHDTSNPRSYVYHVGVYEGGDKMVAAATSRQGVVFQSFSWAGATVTFGHITT